MRVLYHILQAPLRDPWFIELTYQDCNLSVISGEEKVYTRFFRGNSTKES